jgi:hypothetical protein
MSTIPAGTYAQVTVTGVCHILGAVTGPAVGPNGTEVITNCGVPGGPVTILGNLTVAPDGFLDAGSCAPSVTVGGNVSVGDSGTLILGCEPFLVIMPPVPPFPTLCPGLVTTDTIGGNVVSTGALAIIVHETAIGGNVSLAGGGGGVNCTPDLNLSAALDSKLGTEGPTPAYTDFEDNRIGGNVAITGLQGCWFGIFRNQVQKNVILTGNTFNDPDAMEVTDNIVGHNLICVGNTPTVHLGDSGGGPNKVTGLQLGQCKPPLPQ